MTSEVWLGIAAVVLGYFLGSIPSAYIAGRLVKGIDIRTVGSKNMGAMNSIYSLGLVPGLIVLAADIGKGVAAVGFAQLMGAPTIAMFLAGTAAVLGHSFPVWLGFRGGKGGAPLVGVFIYLMPWGILIGLSIFGLLLFFTRFPTLSYSLALLSFPFIAWLINGRGDYVIYSCLMLLIPLLLYIPRIKEMRAKSGNWKHFAVRKNLKDRF
jgi:glycerol-3-phosphate acyltransferase PlsY